MPDNETENQIALIEQSVDVYEKTELQHAENDLKKITQVRSNMSESKGSLFSKYLSYIQGAAIVGAITAMKVSPGKATMATGIAVASISGALTLAQHLTSKIANGSSLSKKAVDSSLNDVYAVNPEVSEESKALADAIKKGDDAS